MKKIFIILLTLILLVGCNKHEVENLDGNKKTLQGTELNLLVPMFYGTESETNIEKRNEFLELIQDNFGIKLQVTLMNDFFTKYDSISEFNGFSKVQRISLPSLIQSEQIIPLDQYLENNIVWSNLPNYYKENGRISGTQWGIPANDIGIPTYKVRFIRQDWVDKFNIDTPDTIQEYFEVAKLFTYNDPDGNGLNDTTGMLSNGLSGLFDIFNSYNCSIGYFRPYQQVWDPEKNVFYDGLQNENIIDCLLQLKQCYEEKILNNDFVTFDQRMLLTEYAKGKVGSVCHYITLNDEMEELTGTNNNIIIGLNGIKEKNVIPAYSGSEEFYVLTAQTINKKHTVDNFISIFLGSPEGYFMGAYGVPQNDKGMGDFKLDEERVTLNYEIIDNEVSMPVSPSLFSGHPVYSKYEVVYSRSKDNIYPENVISNYDRQLLINTFVNNEKSIFIMPHKYQDISREYFNANGENIREEIHIIGTEIIIACIKGEVNAVEAISEYKKTAEEYGLNAILDKVNIILQMGNY